MGRTHLDVPTFVLERHRQHPGDVPVESTSSSSDVVIQPHQACTHAVAECENASKRWPIVVLVRNFRVALSGDRVSVPSMCGRRREERTYVAMFGIVHMGIDTAL